MAELELRPNGPVGVLLGAASFPRNKLHGAVFAYGLNSNDFDMSDKSSVGNYFSFDFQLSAAAFNDLNPERSGSTETQFGAGFGGAVGTGDFDGDSYTDIAVGAPLWNNINDAGYFPETGRVYIFRQTKNDLRKFSEELGRHFVPNTILSPTGSTFAQAADGRFGSAIASDGDLNGDGFSQGFKLYV